MKQKLGRKLLSFLLTLAMVLGLVPGMGLTAYAATVDVTGITLDPATASMTVGDTETLTATVEPDNATDKKVKWNVGGTNADAVKLYTDEACTSEVGTDATETLTVYAKGISAGSATVTATSNADSEKSASCDVTVNDSQTQTEGLITTITATGKEQASYNPENVATVSFSYTANGSSSYTNNGTTAIWGWWGYGWTATVTPVEGYTITKCVFYDDKDRTATDSEAPFVVETTESNKEPQVNGTPILANRSKGITKIEVYGYATPASSYSVTITPDSNMTKTTDSGAASQADLSGSMTPVVYTADEGYYFPTDYSVDDVDGITVTRNSYTQITVSGTPTADAEITLTAPTAKTTPDAPTTAAATDCTTADNNDGKLTGVTTAMEYKKSDAADWTAGTGSDITGLVPGTYYVRIKATDTTLASDNQELTVNAAQTQMETLLTTVTPTGKSTYSETTAGVVTVTFDPYTYNSTYGWLWFESGSVSVAANEGYTITKCVFRQNAKDPITVSAAPFAIHFEYGMVKENRYSDMDGITSIEVYGYASKAAQTITAEDVTVTYGDTDKSVSATVTEPTTGGGEISYAVKTGSEDYIDVASDGKLTIKKVPSDGKAYVTVTAAATDDYAQATKEVTVTINTKAMTFSAEDVNVTVDGQPHGITVNVTDPASGATVKYGTEEGSYTLDASPTQTEVGTLTVYYQVTADNYTTYTGSATVTVSDKSTQTITASDVTATYGDTGKKVEATTDGNGAISYAVKDGSGDYIEVNASTGALTIKKVGTATVIVTAAETATYAQATKEVTVTINKANAIDATVTANSRTYDGTDKPLVNVDNSTLVGGTMQYALGTATEATQPYTTSIPTGTNAGTYYVWYKVIGDENHSDFTADKAVLVEIKADTTAPTGEISIDTNKWTSFLSTITFGLFFKETKEVTITAEDDLTGVQRIEYYVSDQAISLEQVKAVTEWKTYESTFKLNPEKKYVVYARLTDKAGNITYISSNGLVFVNLPVGYVTDITKNSATLNMQLSAAVQSEVRTAGFEYKKKADADTAWTKVEGDFASGTVTKKLTSLTAGTDYVFRPYVTYTNDTMDTGAEINFTTDTKPAVTGSIAVKVKNETDGTKDVIVTIEEGNYALASQEKDGIAAGEEVTTGKFKELPDGTYNIVIKSKDGEFVETKMITIANGAAETISFTISKGEMKTDVEVEADTPKVAVDGLSKEELVQSGTITSEEKTKVESGEISLEVTLKAEKKETSKVETKTVSAIQQVMAESSTKLVVDMFLDLSLFKTVTQLTGDQAGKTDETNIGSTNTKVLEIAVPYDTTIKGLVVYRYHGSAASALKKLSSAPAKGAAHEDGTFYLSDKYIHIFASGFSTYAIAKEEENSSGGSGGGGGTTPVTPGKITPSKPAAPTLDSKTDTSITVKTVAGQEYSRDGGKTWQTSGTFTGLTPETEYSIVTKIAATSTANESPVSDALKVTTDKKADSSTPTPGSTTTPTDKPTETPGSTTAPTDKPTETPGATDTPSTTTTPGATSAPADKVTKTEKAKAKLSLNAGLKVSCVGKKVTVKWGKVSKADRYVVYAAYCGPDKCTKIKALSGSKTSMTFTKLNGSKLNLKKNVKVYVIAYRKVNGKETKLAKSITAHVVGTKNEKYTNVKKIKLSKSSYTLKVNKTATVKAEIVLEDKKKKQLSDGHAPEFRYASSNTKVATVDANGRIKAVGKGTCYIYVYAKNGYAKKIKVVVK